MYIKSISGVTYQDTFGKVGFSKDLKRVTSSSEIVHPEYADLISPGARRRMSDVVKMAVVSALNCLSQHPTLTADGIIVGTAHGCPQNTRKFLASIHHQNGGLLSPTPFMLSTHNTISGQISLLTKNRGYNTTHTQSSLSFEHALIDAMMLFQEGKEVLLVGSSDELDLEVMDIKYRLKNDTLLPGYGATFCLLTSKISDAIRIKDVHAESIVQNTAETLRAFLGQNNIEMEDIDAIYYSCSNNDTEAQIKELFRDKSATNIIQYCKTYFTNSSFALHLTVDAMRLKNHKYSLVFNNLMDENLGLILLENTQ